MQIRSKTLSIIFKFVIIAFVVAGVLINFGIFEGRFDSNVINFFTTLSNLFCMLYCIFAIVWQLRQPQEGSKLTFCPTWRGMAMLSIIVTMLVAHTMLRFMFEMTGAMGFSAQALHTIVPLLFVLNWLLFDSKGNFKKWSPLLWLVPAYVYFGYALIAAQIGDGIGCNGSRYPYPFLDIDANGLSTVLLTVLVLTVFFIALGYGIYFLDRAMGRRKKTK